MLCQNTKQLHSAKKKGPKKRQHKKNIQAHAYDIM